MTDTIANLSGRKGGRGIRTWLLVPKIIGVIVYVGGLAAVLGLWLASDFTSLSLTDPRRKLVLDLVSRLLVFLVVPALLITLISGLLLLMQLPRAFLRARWMQVKLVALLIMIPAAHFYCRSRFDALRVATSEASSAVLAKQLTWGLLAAFAGSTGVVVIARLKPRFSSNPPENPSE